MKKPFGILLVIVLFSLITGCGNSTVSGADDVIDYSRNALPENFVMLDAGEWPENEYTAGIPEPVSGTVSQGWIDPDTHRCCIDLTGVSSKAMENWYNSLLSNGFAEIGKIAEEIKGQNYTSINALLKKDGVYISMTHLSTEEGNLWLSISRET
jgi:hypothetical protein